MKNHLLLIGVFAIILLTTVPLSAQVSISTDNSAADNSALLDVKSTNKGVLLPRITYEQRNTIISPAEGLMVFCTNCGTDGALSVYSNGAWRTYSPCTIGAPTTGPLYNSLTQIIWNWTTVSGATGYKWNTANNYNSAFDMGTTTTKTEAGLTCNTSYSRYVWAYNACGTSVVTTLTRSTTAGPNSPRTGIIIPSSNQIIWNWQPCIEATGYKWNTTDDYETALDMGNSLSKTETGLSPNTFYARFVWAYNYCGVSESHFLDCQTTP